MTEITEQKTDWLNQGPIIANEWNNNMAPSINITVLARDWAELWTFAAEKGKVFTTLATENWVEIPMSCGAWACGLCLCEIIQWVEYINKAYSMPGFMELEENQVLTCIAAVKDECFDNNVEAIIVIKRTI